MSIITTCPAHEAQCTTAAGTQGYLWDLLTKLELESLTADDNDTSSLSGDPMRIPGVLGHPALAVGL